MQLVGAKPCRTIEKDNICVVGGGCHTLLHRREKSRDQKFPYLMRQFCVLHWEEITAEILEPKHNIQNVPHRLYLTQNKYATNTTVRGDCAPPYNLMGTSTPLDAAPDLVFLGHPDPDAKTTKSSCNNIFLNVSK